MLVGRDIKAWSCHSLCFLCFRDLYLKPYTEFNTASAALYKAKTPSTWTLARRAVMSSTSRATCSGIGLDQKPSWMQDSFVGSLPATGIHVDGLSGAGFMSSYQV